ncbi:MAG: hypothetical protein LBL64_00240 [Treponema sp.]|nr:hypothetical protein [Treponema sp.]
MSTLDTLFPNPMNCYFALFQDAVFEHDANVNYVFQRGQFKRRDKTAVIMKIAEMAKAVYTEMTSGNTSFDRCEPIVDYSALLAVVSRYSRDVYGFRRIKAKLENLENVVGKTANLKEEIESIVLESGDFGFLIPSTNPYIHREAAVLLYWFSVLKPFHLNFKKGAGSIPEGRIIAYFNEYFAYSLINVALHPWSAEMKLHEHWKFFIDEFLNQLHFRNLSRSSLEFFLPGWIKEIYSDTNK